MMKRTFGLVVALAMVPALASAQGIVATTPIAETGAGLGNRITVLTLQKGSGTYQGVSDDISTGCIAPDGTLACGLPDNVVQNQSSVRLISELGTGSGDLGTDLRIIANFAEPGNDQSITLQDLVMKLYVGDNATAVATFNLVPASLTFDPAGTGTGGEGFAFRLDAAGILAFNAATTGGADRIGLGAFISDNDSGNDTFSLQRVNSTQSVVPEPSTYALMAAGLAGIFVARRRRNRA